MHIGKECAISYGVSFALPKDSIFTEKFGEVILNIWYLLELAFPSIESLMMSFCLLIVPSGAAAPL